MFCHPLSKFGVFTCVCLICSEFHGISSVKGTNQIFEFLVGEHKRDGNQPWIKLWYNKMLLVLVLELFQNGTLSLFLSIFKDFAKTLRYNLQYFIFETDIFA